MTPKPVARKRRTRYNCATCHDKGFVKYRFGKGWDVGPCLVCNVREGRMATTNTNEVQPVDAREEARKLLNISVSYAGSALHERMATDVADLIARVRREALLEAAGKLRSSRRHRGLKFRGVLDAAEELERMANTSGAAAPKETK